MTRIIAGAIGSLQLKPAAKATRPTSDRVKESLFAKLGAMGVIEGARVLDLFAGTGALGLEAASRGAKQVTLVERDRKAFELLQQNVKSAKSAFEKQEIEVRLEVENLDAGRFLKSKWAKYDLIFIDPPYDFANESLQVILGQLCDAVSDDGLIIVERSSRTEELKTDRLELQSSKVYGDTSVWIYQKP